MNKQSIKDRSHKVAAGIHTYSVRTTFKPLVVALLCFWLPVMLFAKLAGEILERDPIGIDHAILHWLHAQTSPGLDAVFLFFTNAGNALFIIALSAVPFCYLVVRKHYAKASVLLFGVGGAAAANLILKLLFHRDRPAFWPSIISEHSYSFPSGHAMGSSALALAIVLAAWHTRWRWPTIICGTFFTLMVGLSRLYFGVHFPTDVVAGWCVSVAWVVIVSSLALNFPFALRKRLQR